MASIGYFTILLPSVLHSPSIIKSKFSAASSLKIFIFKSFITYFWLPKALSHNYFVIYPTLETACACNKISKIYNTFYWIKTLDSFISAVIYGAISKQGFIFCYSTANYNIAS